jgi:hypothetical protein
MQRNMASTTDTRSNWHTWSPAYETAPPASCQTLRNYKNVVEFGYQCVFAREDGDPIPFSINTACMPWVTPNVYAVPTAFYSPATACPTSWTAVSTATTGEQWASGETGVTCCPAGFEGDGRGGCKVGTTGTFPVVQCGDADAEENESRTYTAGAWPATATASIMPLRLRYRASDIGSATGSGRPPSSTSSSGSTGSASDGGLSTGAKAAIGTIIPLVFLLGAMAFFLLWRRRRQKIRAVALAAKNMGDEKEDHTPGSQPHGIPLESKMAGAAAVHQSHNNTHETPEWNAEMDATEAERQRLVTSQHEFGDAVELGGTSRVPRKPIAPVEIDGVPVTAEIGDAYIPYRPGTT